mmetsp:Transcript_8990/g.8890  ORF Transcript_8990/g.8890 Transcript_8990/m.8890 type:complete len:479 (-) Transcript_8990:74-1510(-)
MLFRGIFLLINLLILSSANTVTVTSTRDYRVGQSGLFNEDKIEATVTRNRASDLSNDISSAYQTTAVTSCHLHGNEQFCIDGEGNEGSIVPAPSRTEDSPSSYTECHSHGEDTFCLNSEGNEVQFMKESESSSTSTSSSSGGENCHFHAGVEHCVSEGESEHGASTEGCERVDRDYNIPLRIGLLFVILASSAIGSFGPILLTSFFKFKLDGIVITILKQFGTGIIISTAFVHLMTHADLMWGNSCITLGYESTATSITMAGIFLTFLIEYLVNRLIKWRAQRSSRFLIEKGNPEKTNDITEETISQTITPNNNCSIIVHDEFSCVAMEAGIVFHSILLGITLVVAGDSYFITLFIVILFHQMFEGIALSTRIVELTETKLIKKLIMAGVYSIVTPVGMAIGIGTLNQFNGNDPSTIIALGTLDSFSAGILIWTGLIEMWAHDWIFGSLASASFLKTSIALVSLIAGFILMSVLGKWA